MSDILRYIVDAIQYEKYLKQYHDKDGESRWGNVGELISYAKQSFDSKKESPQNVENMNATDDEDAAPPRQAIEKASSLMWSY